MKAVMEDVKAAVQSVEVKKKNITDLNLEEAGSSNMESPQNIFSCRMFV